MKLIIKCQDADGVGGTWEEDYDRPEVKDLEDAREYAFALVANYNATLRPHERARKVLDVRLVGESDGGTHDFQKQNLVTVMNPRLGFYDILKCRNCPVTAKRYGVDRVLFDGKYRAQKWQKCKRTEDK